VRAWVDSIARMPTRPAAVLAAVLLCLLPSACGDDGEDDTRGTDADAEPTCTYTPDGAQPAKTVTPPPEQPTETGEVTVTLKTSVGDLEAVLDAGSAPCTVNSFLSLAEQGYYDDSQCHRLGVTPGFYMLQCGDPSATGFGGPGYTIEDEYDGSETYPAGTLAMANQGRADTGGAQFFLVYRDTKLDPQYTVFGTMDAASIGVLQSVAAKGTDDSEGPGVGKPKQPVTITDVG
jgi:peptidyl-prolyl cis-trans isomerase B (cyclophilin B)